MRAICGAIIVAGAMIGLGLTALGIGNRYHKTLENIGSDNQIIPLHLHDMDRPMIYILGFLTVVAVIGMGITFLGLAYHHHRRHLEIMRDHPQRASAKAKT
jgi:hypothetical protein